MPALRSARKRYVRRNMPYSPRRNTLKYVMGRGGRAKQAKRIRFGNGITTQNDVANIYRRKSMPRYKKRKWVSFVRKVKAVLYKGLGTKTVLFNTQMSGGRLSVPENQQGVFTIALYGFWGDTDNPGESVGNRDLYRIAINDPEINKKAVSPTFSIPNNGKLLMSSAVLDLTLTNIGTIPSEVDVYIITCGIFNNNGSLREAFIDADANQITISGSGNGINALVHRGATPFEMPLALSSNRLRILSKKKYFLGAGQTITYQYRDAKNHYINCSKFYDQAIAIAEVFEGPFNYPGVTKNVLIVHKTVSGAPAGAQSQLSCGVTRKYSYNVDESTLTKQQLNPA